MASVITNIGTGSGLPLQQLLTDLMVKERVPLTQLQAKEATTLTKVSAYGQLSNAVSKLRDTIQGLTTAKFNGATAATSDKEVATVTADNKATKGNFSLEVIKLAEAEKAVSGSTKDADTKFATGTLTFNFGSLVDGAFVTTEGSAPQTVTIDGSNNTLAGIRDAVNKAAIGVSVSLVNDGNGSRLVFSSTNTGAAHAFKIEGSGESTSPETSMSQFDYDPSTAIAYDAATAASGMRRLQQAQDAEIKVDGLAIKTPKNTVSDAVDGVTLTLLKAGTSKITLAQDPAAARTSMQSLVTAYNSFLTTANGLSTNIPGATPGQTNSTNGPLAGDGVVRDIVGKMRDQIFAVVDGAPGQYNSLATLGVSFQKDGTLKMDTAIFDKAMAADPKAVADLFTDDAFGQGKPGITKRFADVLTSIVDDNGAIKARTDGLTESTKQLQAQQVSMQKRLVQIQARYQAQFIALDQLVTGMNGTTTFLNQQLESLASLRAS